MAGRMQEGCVQKSNKALSRWSMIYERLARFRPPRDAVGKTRGGRRSADKKDRGSGIVIQTDPADGRSDVLVPTLR